MSELDPRFQKFYWIPFLGLAAAFPFLALNSFPISALILSPFFLFLFFFPLSVAFSTLYSTVKSLFAWLHSDLPALEGCRWDFVSPVLVRVLQRERDPIGDVNVYIYVYYKLLTHVTMEAALSHDLLSLSWDPGSSESWTADTEDTPLGLEAWAPGGLSAGEEPAWGAWIQTSSPLCCVRAFSGWGDVHQYWRGRCTFSACDSIANLFQKHPQRHTWI